MPEELRMVTPLQHNPNHLDKSHASIETFKKRQEFNDKIALQTKLEQKKKTQKKKKKRRRKKKKEKDRSSPNQLHLKI